jgi:hypothetical protein
MTAIEGYIGNSQPSNSTVDLGLRFGQQWNFPDDNFQCTSLLHHLYNIERRVSMNINDWSKISC